MLEQTEIAKVEPHHSSVDAGTDFLPLVPAQFYQPRCLASQHGEYQLLSAVLQEALHTYLNNRNFKSGKRCHDYWEARRWFESRGTNFLFDFQTICQLLDIDPDALRRKLGLGPAQCYQERRSSGPAYNEAASATRAPRVRTMAKKPGMAVAS